MEKEKNCCCGLANHSEEYTVVASCDCNGENAINHLEHSCSCGCGEHKEETCSCGSHNEEEKCSCESKKEEKETCGCGEHKEENCSCESHKEEHSCGCGEQKEEEHCSCGHHHKVESHSCCCGENSGSHLSSSCGCGIDHSKSNNKKDLQKLIISFIFLVIGFFRPYHIMGYELFHYVDPSIVAVILCGIPIFKGAFNSIFRDKKIRASVLVTIAVMASVVLEIMLLSGLIESADGHGHGFMFAAGEIVFLMMTGQLIESITVGKSKKGIEELVSLAPKNAFVLKEGKFVEIALDLVKVGDIVQVLPEGQISVDGIIVKGKTSVDEACLTGESLPVDKGENDEVFGGTWNKEGVIEIKVTKLKKDMAVTKLISLVEEASGKKAPISLLADKWATVIVPTALVLSFIVGLFSSLVFKLGYLEAVNRAVTILVVFCPCALTLATPTAVSAGIGNTSSRGILVKSGKALETIAKVDVVAFDKTGTLTEGELEVKGFEVEGVTEDEFLSLAKSIESYSNHPIAKAILKMEQGKILEVTEAKTSVGIGVSGYVNGNLIEIVKFDNLKVDGLSDEANTKLNIAFNEGFSLACLRKSGEYIGFIKLADTIRENAKSTIEKLHSLGIKTIMLTGDNEKIAKGVGDLVGVSEVYFSLMPQDKLDIIEKLQKSGKTVCMVGDGINDAPSLALANTSIAMANLGAEVAIETAETALLSADINKIYQYIKFSKKVFNRIKFNLGFSVVFNLLSATLATMGVLNPVSGAIMHNLSSLFVVISSALLLNVKKVWFK